MSKNINVMPTLGIAELFKPRSKNGFIDLFNKDQTLLFAFGRDAIIVLAQLIKEKNNKKVLLPSYICDVAILPFVGIIDFVFYDIDETFIITPEMIEAKMDQSIGLVLIVDYFGFEQPYKKEILDICRKHGAELFEDLAHKLPAKTGKYQTNKVIGDYALFSLHKQLPISDGAAFLVKDRKNKEKIESLVRGRRTVYRSVRTFIKIIKKHYRGENPSSVAPPEKISSLPSLSEMWGGRPKPYGNRISFLAYFVLKKLNQSRIFEKRIAIYNYYAENIKFGKNVSPIKTQLSECDSPFVFPMIINNPTADVRVRLQLELPGYFWPRLYAGIRMDYTNNIKPIDLAEKVYYLSIQQELTQSELLHIVTKFNEIAAY